MRLVISGLASSEENFNPRTPCGVRPRYVSPVVLSRKFQSTHPLRGATRRFRSTLRSRKFQSTHPLRGATRRRLSRFCASAYFNPRTPCGVRRFPHRNPPTMYKFQSTHPLRGATAKLPKYSRQICAKATKFLQSRTKSGVAACWAKGRRLLFPTLRGANLPGKTGTLPVRIRQSARPLARNRPWHRSAQRAFHTCCRDNKSAGCLFLCP